MRHLFATVSIAALTLAAAPASAQTAPGSAAPQTIAADSSDTGLADIVVTAQRKSETLQRAAVPVDVVSSAELLNAGIVTAASLNAAVPSLVVTKAGGANTAYYIRGVGNFTVNAYADPAIAFNLDGVYVGRPSGTVGTFYDLERVEVLKGPQGILYGRNATGGAINVIPTRPQPGETSGYFSGGYGNFKALDLEAAINLPMGQDGAIRVSGKLVDSNGYTDDGTNDEVGQAFRVQMLTHPTDSFTVRVSGDYTHQGGVGPGPSFNGVYSFAPGVPATPTSIANYIYTPAPATITPRSGLHTPASKAYFSTFVIGGAFINPAPYLYPFLDNSYFGANAEFTLDTSVGTLTFIPAYRNANINMRFNGPAFAGGLNDEDDDQFSAELRFAGNRIGPVEYLLGAYFFDESIKARYTFAQYQVSVFQDFTTGTRSYAGFGRATVHLSDALRLVGGIRYTEDKKRFNAVSDTLVEICANAPPPAGPGCFGGPSVSPAATIADLNLSPRPIPNGPPVPFGTRGNLLLDSQLIVSNRKLPSNRLTYRVAGEFDVTPTSLLYASYETGYHGGGFSLATGYETYLPEYIAAITLGSKNRFFGNRLQLNVEAYRWKYTNQQISHFGFDAAGRTNLFTENLGRSTIQGVDVDAEFLATPTTLLRASAQYLDNKVNAFTYTAPRGGTNLPPITGCPVSNSTRIAGGGTVLVYEINCAGQAGYFSPKWSFNAGFNQTVELGDHKIVLTSDGRYRSNRITGFERLPQQTSGSDLTFDASLSFGSADDKWAITGWVRNITDQDVAVAAQYSGSTGGSVTTNYAPPRTYGVRASVKF